MAKEICISVTPHETRLAILEDDQLAEIYYERENEYTLAGSIYKGRVTRVLPGMQSSFVDLGLERDAFLYVTDFLEDSEDQDEYETSSPAPASGRPARAAALPAPASPEEAPAALEERSERRGRRDGRRGGGRRGERPEPVAEATPSASPNLEPPQAPAEPRRRARASEERAAATVALRSAVPQEADRAQKGDTEAEGEDSPEGTRRWRGRRGRRRGGMRAGVLGAAASPEDVQPATAPFDLPERGAPGGMAAPVAISAATPETFESHQTRTPAERATATGLDLQAAASPAREPRTPREPREPRTPRSEASAPARQGREQSAAQSGSIVLPGESLAKYGSAPASSDSPAAIAAKTPGRPTNYTPPKPATQVEVGLGWDGGAVLPGETLSRYRGPAGPSAASAEPTPATSASESDAVPAGSILALPSAPEQALAQPTPIDDILTGMAHGQPASQAPATDSVAAEEFAAPELAVQALPGAEQAEQQVTHTSPVDPAGQSFHAAQEAGIEAPAPEQATAPTEAATADEYEPSEGESATRSIPPSTSELRLSQLFGIGGNEPDKPETPKQPAEHEQAPSYSWDATRSTLEAGLENDPATPQAGPEAESQHRPAASSDSDSDVRMTAHETHAPSDSFTLNQVQPGDGFADLVDQLHGYAPGSGFMEEEVIDEEEYDFDPVHAHAEEHDLEDLEEETLSGEPQAFAPVQPPSHQAQEPSESTETNREADRKADREFWRANRSAEQEHDHAEESAHDSAHEGIHQTTEFGSPFAFDLLSEEAGDETSDALSHEMGDEAGDEEQLPATPGEPQRRERSREDRGARSGRSGRSGRAGGGRRQSAQTQDLPIISDLLKQGQEILVQIAKEPMAKKGARITSHIALPGRFLVFMPTVGHVGVSRKIASDEERLRLKRILISEKGDFSGGFIVRTAAEGASEEELRADLRFLINLWSEIKQRAESAKAPALIYHDLNLVERILRDQVSSNFSTIWVDSEQEYERIVRFLGRFQPALVRRVKLYTKTTPLFEHFGIQDEISKALQSKVWLKSGGSIVINQTEALVAIDINTGKYVGKTARLEDTIVKTNLDAIPEIVRQIRLRDLGGIIVIDFIDMDERKNRNRVLAALEEAMKVDRAPSKVLQFNDFGLVAITRKRVKQSLERTLSVPCEVCTGTGMVKSPITVCNEIYTELRKMLQHLDGKDVMLRVHPEVAKQLKSSSGRWLGEYEEMVGKSVIIKSDAALSPEQFDIH